MIKRARERRRCCVCGEEYKAFVLEPYEAQIPDAGSMCKECLEVAVEEEWKCWEEIEEDGTC